jgi:RNA-directed DNA polymerase
MTAAWSAGAPAPAPLDGPQSHWHALHRTVPRLQTRIVQAMQGGRGGKVQALPPLRTPSCSGKALAVRRGTAKHGNRTPGVDGETWSTPAQQTMAIDALRRRGYHPRPLRRVSMAKSHGTRRPWGLPTLHDRAMQALSLLALAPVAATTAEPHSSGLRPARSPADARGPCSLILHKPHAPTWRFEGDIHACVERSSHAWLLPPVPMDTVSLRQGLQAGYLARHPLHPTDSGPPQGGLSSPVLAQLALDGLARCLQTACPQNGRGRQATINLVRYADDGAPRRREGVCMT